MVSMLQVQEIARPLPRSYEVYVHRQCKYRIGSIVWLAFSRDETVMGFAFPKEWRQIVVEAEPHKFMLPRESDMRFNWVHARLAALEYEEMHDLVIDAWKMAVPKRVAAEWDAKQHAALAPGRRSRPQR